MNHPAAETIYGIPGVWLSWFIVAIGLIAFAYTLSKRYRLIRLGQKDPRWSDIGERLRGLIVHGFLQKRQPRYLLAGILHIVIFWGFIVLGLHSIELVVAGLWPGTGLPFLQGGIGAGYNALKDVFVLAVLITVLIAVYRRAAVKPDRYQGSHQSEAYLVLFLIAFLMVTNMFYEGSGLASSPEGYRFLPAAWIAKLLLGGADRATLGIIHNLSYWLHLLCFFYFLNLLPMSKHFHIITALPNVLFRRLDRGAVKPPRWDTVDMEQLDTVGVKGYPDLTWKHILDLCSCTECGRCTDNCPANAVGRPLSPKQFSMDLRDFGYRSGAADLRSNAAPIAGEVIPDEIFWSCTTCGACERECPVFIEYIDKMIELRRYRVSMESNFPPEIEQAYRNMEVYGDSYGMGAASRTNWARGLKVNTVRSEPEIDILFWVGCAGAFDSRSQLISAAFVNILNRAEVNFGILGEEEGCCGDYARRTGNEYLFQQLANRNIATLREHGIRRIVTTCPHGYNTLKNEYPQLGGEFEVVHASELVLGLLESKKLEIEKPLEKTVAYHDPCYLGRHNQIYDVPRRILAAIPGLSVAEPDRTRDRSFCCGAGGGHYWMESSGERINDTRTEQLLEASPDMLSTGCPYCLIMLEDGVESKEMKGQVPVKDVIELVADSI